MIWGERDLSKVEQRLLRYTCNCGWLDIIHAGLENFSRSNDPEEGQWNLWQQLATESKKAPRELNGRPTFLVKYRQRMSHFGASAGYRGAYLVHRGIPIERKRTIGLRILLDVSAKFERLQGSFPYGLVLDSSFSAEDVVSNVVGYFRAVYNLSDGAVYLACKEVTKSASIATYAAHTRQGLGKRKNVGYTHPIYFPCDECTLRPAFPKLFEMTPAEFGYDFARYPKEEEMVRVSFGG